MVSAVASSSTVCIQARGALHFFGFGHEAFEYPNADDQADRQMLDNDMKRAEGQKVFRRHEKRFRIVR